MMTRLLLESWFPWQPEVCDLAVVEQPRRAMYLKVFLLVQVDCYVQVDYVCDVVDKIISRLVG